MNNIYISKAKKVKNVIEKMPYFTIDGLSSLDIKDYYLKIILSRLKERGDVVSLKRGVYVSFKYLEEAKRKNNYNKYMEFLSGVLYFPSYLSLEYILSEYNVLSESSFGFSAISTKKTNNIKNKLGSFYYYNLKKDLFTGFKTEKVNNFFIYRATLGKALFDFLYLRKNILLGKESIEALRINIDQVSKEDFKEFKHYALLAKSKKMEKIVQFYEG